MVLSGNSAFRALTAFRPSALISGVPASTQSAPPATASRATSSARGRSTKSSATWTSGRSLLGSQSVRAAGARAHTPITCTTMRALARARVEVAEDDVLVDAEGEAAVDEGDDQRRPHEPGAHVRVAVAVAEVHVVPVEAVGGGDHVERPLHVLHDARLVLERRERAGGAGDEQGDGAVGQAGPAHGLLDLVGDLDHVGIAVARELDGAGDDAHEALAHVVLLLAVDEDGRHGGPLFHAVASLAGYALSSLMVSMRRVEPRRAATTSLDRGPSVPSGTNVSSSTTAR